MRKIVPVLFGLVIALLLADFIIAGASSVGTHEGHWTLVPPDSAASPFGRCRAQLVSEQEVSITRPHAAAITIDTGGPPKSISIDPWCDVVAIRTHHGDGGARTKTTYYAVKDGKVLQQSVSDGYQHGSLLLYW